MQEGRPHLPRPRITRRGWLAVGVILAALLAILASLITRITPHVRDAAVNALNERFDSQTEMATLQVSIFPRPEVSGSGLVVRHKGRRDVPPLITIKSFSASAGLVGLIWGPLHLHTNDLDGLEIHVPPGGLKGQGMGLPKDDGAGGGDKGEATSIQKARERRQRSPIVIDTIRSRAARLEIATDDPGKLPRVFEIHDLVMEDFGFDRAASFDATLTNWKPAGEIHAKGTFGPWNTADPRMTPLGADYTFSNAKLDTIKGIGGTLSSTGRFHGVLERIRVEGTTDTPDFMVDVAGQPVHLRTTFTAIVDATNGNTWLDPVEATLLDHSRIVARGEVVRSEDVKGRKVSLQVTIDDARVEEILRLAIKSKKTPLTGAMKLETSFLLPAGEADVPERLQLDGRFAIKQARFTQYNVQQRIDTLSRRGRGNTGDGGPSVVSNLSGRFVMKNGRIRFHDLTFAVPGSVVQLAGSYDLPSEQLDFDGHLLLDAALHETVTGYKSFLARIAQPFFRRKGGGSKLPIRVSGTPDHPAFGLDVKKALTPGD
jgi:hypothetical protein